MAEMLTCTRIINILGITGFIVSYLLRINMSAAIVTMIKSNFTNNSSLASSIPQYDWTISEKNYILGIFFIGYAISKVFFGRICELLGPRIVIGCGTLLIAVLTLLIPTLCEYGFYIIVIIRFLIGFFSGPFIPGYAVLVVKWFPLTKRSKMVSNLASFSIGVVITYQLSGFLNYYYGWSSIFYVTGAIGILWSCCWFYFIYDSPHLHPRITSKEKDSIERKMRAENDFMKKVPKQLPIKAILRSRITYVLLCSMGVSGFIHHMIVNQLPTYFNDILHFNVKKNGLLSSIPFVAMYITSVFSGYMADYLIKSKRLSTTNTRKLMQLICDVCVFVSMFSLATWGNNPTTSVLLFIFLESGVSFKYSGNFSNVLDVAPNFAGTYLGWLNAFSGICGYCSTQLVAFITETNNTFEGWSIIFKITCGISIFDSVIYLIFASSKPQSWNIKQNEEETEQPLKEVAK